VTRRVVLVFSIGLFVAACGLPALVLHDRAYLDNSRWVWQSYHSIRGILLLVQGLTMGWMRLNFTAFANLPLWAAWIQFGRQKYGAARSLSAVALVLSIETLQLAFQPYLYDEGGSTKGFLVAPHIGFLCWVGSMAVIWFSSTQMLSRRRSSGSLSH
jgi:hypothetical protein